MSRVYLDWNATAPLRPEARAAMLAAMDALGNPSSVHAEGRAAKALLERARSQVAAALGADPEGIVFTSGATEAAALGLAGRDMSSANVEHDCVAAWTRGDLAVDAAGAVTARDPGVTALQAANSETGILQDLPHSLGFVDAAQAFGKAPFAFDWSGAAMAAVSSHKIGGPRGVGALVLCEGAEVAAQLRGGGQERGRRSGTENLPGIAGFGAAAEAAAAELARGVWEEVRAVRDFFEAALEAGASQTIFVGKGSDRLPNTSCFVTPGWGSETQVMQMDLAGFAISAGSACSSGKVGASRTLASMGFDANSAASAVRVSIGPGVTSDAVAAFAEAWLRQWRRFEGKKAA